MTEIIEKKSRIALIFDKTKNLLVISLEFETT